LTSRFVDKRIANFRNVAWRLLNINSFTPQDIQQNGSIKAHKEKYSIRYQLPVSTIMSHPLTDLMRVLYSCSTASRSQFAQQHPVKLVEIVNTAEMKRASSFE
jgi:hypothetical protein